MSISKTKIRNAMKRYSVSRSRFEKIIRTFGFSYRRGSDGKDYIILFDHLGEIIPWGGEYIEEE